MKFLKNWAQAKITSLVATIRQAIKAMREMFMSYNYREDPLYKMDASFNSKLGDLAANHDKYLYGKEN
jgi:hypothetical protein